MHIPTTLQAQAEQHANELHSSRLAELEALAPLLAQMDAIRPALAERGLTIYPDALTLRRESLLDDGYSSPRHKVLAIRGAISLHTSQRPAWHTALVDLGFRTLRHNAGSAWPSALMRKGTLLVRVDLTAAESNAMAAAAAVPAKQAAEVTP